MLTRLVEFRDAVLSLVKQGLFEDIGLVPSWRLGLAVGSARGSRRRIT